MTRALEAEFLKLRTTRTFFALTASAVGLSVLIVVLFASLGSNLTGDDVHGLFTADFTGLFILLLGAIGMSGEFRHRTIASTTHNAISAKANNGPASPTTGSTNKGATAGPMIVPSPNDDDKADSAATRPLRRVLEAR